MRTLTNSTKLTIIKHIDDTRILETVNLIQRDEDLLGRQLSEYAVENGSTERL